MSPRGSSHRVCGRTKGKPTHGVGVSQRPGTVRHGWKDEGGDVTLRGALGTAVCVLQQTSSRQESVEFNRKRWLRSCRVISDTLGGLVGRAVESSNQTSS